jgi:hypothetical protein
MQTSSRHLTLDQPGYSLHKALVQTVGIIREYNKELNEIRKTMQNIKDKFNKDIDF